MRFLDPEANSEVITQKLKQFGYSISQRSVERIIGEYGLQKKGYIKQIRQMLSQKVSGISVGLWLLIPEMQRLGVWG